MNMFKANREEMLENIEENSIVVLFSGNPPHKSADAFYLYWPERNFYYLTGMTEPNQIFTLYKYGNKIKETLWVIEREAQEAKWIGDVIHKDEASLISEIDDVRNIHGFTKFMDMILLNGDMEYIYAGFDRRSKNMGQSLEEKFAKDLLEKYPYLKVKNINPIVHRLRMIKKPFEVDLLRKAISITNEGVRSILKNLKPNTFENEMEAHFDFVLKKNNVKWHAFNTIAAGGKNAATLHYEENCKKLNDGDMVLFDLGAQWNQYNADISRTFPVNGKFSQEQKDLYGLVLKANKEVIKSIKPGIPFSDLQKTARNVLFVGLKELGIIETEEELFQYYFHGVSHYLGLDTHDVGFRNVDLKPGMVFTVEPGLYFPEKNIGIRIEDDVIVAKDGCEVLSKEIPKEIDEIEKLMN
ncbi:MAG: aminopeptidase P family protein [Caldisericia bacterium]|nr:aminopeptidase P family protein [Caldisericia bacterium]